MKTLTFADLKNIIDLMASFEVQVVTTGDCFKMIRDIYEQAIKEAGLNKKDFLIDDNSIACSLYHFKTDKHIYSLRDLKELTF